MLRIALIASTLILAAAALPARADDAALVQAAIAKYRVAIDSHDGAALAARYTDDAIVAGADGPLVSGREALRHWADAAVKQLLRWDAHPAKVETAGNLVWEVGTWSGTLAGPQGKAIPVKGNYLNLLERHGDDLLLKVNSFSILPPPHGSAK